MRGSGGPNSSLAACDPVGARTFSPLAGLFHERVALEMLWLETKWASLVSIGVTVALLKDVLPVGATLNAEKVRNLLHRVAARVDAELGDECAVIIEGSPRTRAQLHPVGGCVEVVGISTHSPSRNSNASSVDSVGSTNHRWRTPAWA